MLLSEPLDNYIGELDGDICRMNDEIMKIKHGISRQIADHRPIDASTGVVQLGIVLGIRKHTEEVRDRLKGIRNAMEVINDG